MVSTDNFHYVHSNYMNSEPSEPTLQESGQAIANAMEERIEPNFKRKADALLIKKAYENTLPPLNFVNRELFCPLKTNVEDFSYKELLEFVSLRCSITLTVKSEIPSFHLHVILLADRDATKAHDKHQLFRTLQKPNSHRHGWVNTFQGMTMPGWQGRYVLLNDKIYHSAEDQTCVDLRKGLKIKDELFPEFKIWNSHDNTVYTYYNMFNKNHELFYYVELIPTWSTSQRMMLKGYPKDNIRVCTTTKQTFTPPYEVGHDQFRRRYDDFEDCD